MTASGRLLPSGIRHEHPSIDTSSGCGSLPGKVDRLALALSRKNSRLSPKLKSLESRCAAALDRSRSARSSHQRAFAE